MSTLTKEQLKENIGAAIGRIPSGVFVATATHDNEQVGMLASWVSQAGFEPARVVVCVSPEREFFRVVQASGTFSLNVLGKNNMNLMKPFSKYAPDQFDGLTVNKTTCGLVLPETVAFMDCKLLEAIPGGDHTILIAEVMDGGLLTDENEPFVHLRKSGFNY